MKTTLFKKIIKEAVKEAIQEELKDILLEAIKSPKSQVVNENATPSQSTPPQSSQPQFSNLREKYMNVLGETELSFTSKNTTPLQITPGMDTVGEGTKLPDGDVPMDMISGLLKNN